MLMQLNTFIVILARAKRWLFSEAGHLNKVALKSWAYGAKNHKQVKCAERYCRSLLSTTLNPTWHKASLTQILQLLSSRLKNNKNASTPAKVREHTTIPSTEDPVSTETSHQPRIKHCVSKFDNRLSITTTFQKTVWGRNPYLHSFANRKRNHAGWRNKHEL